MSLKSLRLLAHRPPHPHADLNCRLNLGVAHVPEVLVKLDATMLKGHNNRGPAKLEQPELIPLLDLGPNLLVLFMDPITLSAFLL